MEKKSSSLLAQIKSKYILQQILSLAFGEMKPVIKLVKYNKSLLNKLDINIKDNYKYVIETKIKKKSQLIFIYILIYEIIFSLLFLIYIIIFKVSGKFNDETLIDGYFWKKKKNNLKKKKFVDFMDNFILFAYFGFLLISIMLIIIYFCCKSIALKRKVKLKIFKFIFLVDLTHYITYIIKFAFTCKILRTELFHKCSFSHPCDSSGEGKFDLELSVIWFFDFDIVIIFILTLFLIVIRSLISLILITYEIEEDIKNFFLNQINRINIYPLKLPDSFENLTNKEKNEIIFKKENFSKYEYKSNWDKISLIRFKINDIRRTINIPILRHQGKCLPDFIINEKTKMFFYPNENIYKLSPNFYIFKYPENEFQNHINDKEIMNIIKNETLDSISLIEKNELDYISIYKNIPNDNIQRNNNDNNNTPNIEVRPRIQAEINTNIDVANTDERLSVTEISDKEDNEIGSIKNIKINKNNYQ